MQEMLLSLKWVTYAVLSNMRVEMHLSAHLVEIVLKVL